jgi:hypothetical protein
MDWKQRAQELKAHKPDKCYGRTSLHGDLKSEGFTMGPATVQRWLRKWYAGNTPDETTPTGIEASKKTIETSTDGNSLVITAKSLDIRTLDDLLTEADVDLTIWEVDTFKANAWEMTTKTGQNYTNCQVTAKFKKIIPDSGLDSLLAIISEGIKPRKPITFKQDPGELLYVPTQYDSHIGKLAWAPEVGDDYDIQIATDLYDRATAFGVQRAQLVGKIGKIFLPIGSDLFHVNNQDNETAKGTRQSVDGRLAKIYRVAYHAVIRQIEAFAHIAPIDVVPVRGNHDPEMMMSLMELLAAWFRNTPHVNISTTLKKRSAYMYGDCFIGVCHGDGVGADKLGTVFSTEFPEMWGRAKYRIILIGHWHKQKEMRYVSADTYGNYIVHVCPSLSYTDDWHYEHGFIGDKITEAHVFSKTSKLDTFEITASQLLAMGGG